MGRLCERPGCSEDASVAYGMRAEDLVFWLDVIRPSEEITGGVLCQRHADSMVVPRNWTLDDLRDPELHLFRPPTITRSRLPRSRRVGHRDDTAEQLQFGVLPATIDDGPLDDGYSQETVETSDGNGVDEFLEAPSADVQDAAHLDDPFAGTAPADDATEQVVGIQPVNSDVVAAGSDEDVKPWVPSFDSSDDLDGLLSARSPLLARAFRGADRPG